MFCLCSAFLKWVYTIICRRCGVVWCRADTWVNLMSNPNPIKNNFALLFQYYLYFNVSILNSQKMCFYFVAFASHWPPWQYVVEQKVMVLNEIVLFNHVVYHLLCIIYFHVIVESFVLLKVVIFTFISSLLTSTTFNTVTFFYFFSCVLHTYIHT